MDKDARIFVTGHKGLVGQAIVRRLYRAGYTNVLVADRQEVDLRVPTEVEAYLEAQRPEYLFLAAGKVGGIQANSTYPADFIRDNLQIELSVIDGAYRHGVNKLLFLGSSCIYPKFAPQPIPELALLTGELEPTNEWYAVAKIAGIKLCQAYRRQYGFNAISLMPTNLYGPGDNFNLANSHVVPALMRKMHEAKEAGAEEVVVWGSGRPLREFLHVDDLADACLFLMERYDGEEIVNVGTGDEVSIAGLAELIADVVGFEGQVVYDSSKPDGTPRKRLDVERLQQLGWRPSVPLREGLADTYRWYREHAAELRQ